LIDCVNGISGESLRLMMLRASMSVTTVRGADSGPAGSSSFF
jgi:hypothetical protein